MQSVTWTTTLEVHPPVTTYGNDRFISKQLVNGSFVWGESYFVGVGRNRGTLLLEKGRAPSPPLLPMYRPHRSRVCNLRF